MAAEKGAAMDMQDHEIDLDVKYGLLTLIDVDAIERAAPAGDA